MSVSNSDFITGGFHFANLDSNRRTASSASAADGPRTEETQAAKAAATAIEELALGDLSFRRASHSLHLQD